MIKKTLDGLFYLLSQLEKDEVIYTRMKYVLSEGQNHQARKFTDDREKTTKRTNVSVDNDNNDQNQKDDVEDVRKTLPNIAISLPPKIEVTEEERYQVRQRKKPELFSINLANRFSKDNVKEFTGALIEKGAVNWPKAR